VAGGLGNGAFASGLGGITGGVLSSSINGDGARISSADPVASGPTTNTPSIAAIMSAGIVATAGGAVTTGGDAGASISVGDQPVAVSTPRDNGDTVDANTVAAGAETPPAIGENIGLGISPNGTGRAALASSGTRTMFGSGGFVTLGFAAGAAVAQTGGAMGGRAYPVTTTVTPANLCWKVPCG
jgi:hypothetical protein